MNTQLSLNSNVKYIPYVGQIYEERLKKLEILTVNDLLMHLPFRYDDFTKISPVSDLQIGETVTISCMVLDIKNIFTKNGKRITQATVADDTGILDVIWFNQIYLTKVILKNQKYFFSGKADWFARKKTLISPDYEIVKNDNIHTGRLVPVYPETEGISSKWLRSRIASLLKYYQQIIIDQLPQEIKKQYHLMDLLPALTSVHFPDSFDNIQRARERLAFDELLSLQLGSKLRKKSWETDTVGHVFDIDGSRDKIEKFITNLPFTLTPSQKQTVDEIMTDFKKTYPMNRLLEGDVGSGKTVVAAISMYICYLNGFQSALMAPTEILANQHYQTISALFKPLNINVNLLTGSTNISSDMPPGTGNIFIGTHSLIYDKIHFDNLGLIVIDEQQRFGVEQRETLRKKGSNPHLLSMTATPIPRTIALTMYGELDLSQLTDMPKGIPQVKTWVVPENKRLPAYEWIEKNGNQIFVICPFIEESETLITVKAVKEEFLKLKKVFKNRKIGLLHGKMKNTEKNKVLADFRNKKIDILVSTPVVEVGIDIPQADVMLIEAADRFGLAQLHQLRGRIGRGGQKSYCLLFADNTNEDTIKRLKSLETVYNGPKLAEIDLQLRGSGEISGTRQHGFVKFKAARITDLDLIAKTRDLAQKVVDENLFSIYPTLKNIIITTDITPVSN